MWAMFDMVPANEPLLPILIIEHLFTAPVVAAMVNIRAFTYLRLVMLPGE